jgi:hypothetical protein
MVDMIYSPCYEKGFASSLIQTIIIIIIIIMMMMSIPLGGNPEKYTQIVPLGIKSDLTHVQEDGGLLRWSPT